MIGGRAVRRAVLVAVSAGTILAVATPANADSAQSLAGPNMWIVKEFAQEAAIQGTNNALNELTKANVNGPTSAIPTTPVPPTAGKSSGFRIKGRGLLGGILTLAQFSGMGLELFGAGAPDPATVLPDGGIPAAYPPGWNAQPVWSYSGTSYTWDVLPGATPQTVQITRTLLAGGAWFPQDILYYCKSAAASYGSTTNERGRMSGSGGGSKTITATCNPGEVIDFIRIYADYPNELARWWPQAAPQRPYEGAAADPEGATRELTATVKCKQPDGSFIVMAQTSAKFTLAQIRSGAAAPALPAVTCPSGIPVEVQPNIKTTLPNGGTVDTPLSDPIAAPSSVRDRGPGLADGTDPGLELERKPGPDGVPQNCNNNPLLCRGWYEQPDKEQTYQCRDGGVIVPLVECDPYRRAFDPEPSFDPVAPAESQKCWPSGWGLINPLEWVYRPVSCALTAAFVPTRSDSTLTGIKTTLNDSAPVVWFNAFSDPFEGWSIEGSGCRGPGFELWGVGVYVFSACDAPMSNVASVTKAFATVAVAIFGGYACLRGILVGFSISLPRLGGGSGGD